MYEVRKASYINHRGHLVAFGSFFFSVESFDKSAVKNTYMVTINPCVGHDTLTRNVIFAK